MTLALAGQPYIPRVSKRKQPVWLGMMFVDARADMLDGFEKQVGSWIKIEKPRSRWVQVISSRNDSSRNTPLPRADGSTEKDFIPQDCYLSTSLITILS
jgi:hypothetical protein